MSGRTTTAELRQLVVIISERLGRPAYGWDEVPSGIACRVGALDLDISYGQPRLHEVVNAGGGVREIGPRLPRGQMADYLRAILHGIDLAESNIGGYGSLPGWSERRGARA